MLGGGGPADKLLIFLLQVSITDGIVTIIGAYSNATVIAVDVMAGGSSEWQGAGGALVFSAEADGQAGLGTTYAS